MPLSDRVRTTLEGVWEAQGRSFASFEFDGGELWIQYLDGELNVSWPFDEAPESVLAERGVSLPEGTLLLGWWPGENAIFGVGALLLPDVADLIVALLEEVLDLPPGDEPDCRIQPHA